VHAGAEQAAKELGNVEVLWKGSQNENDTEGQINVVQDFTAQKVDGIVLAPNDSSALVDAVRGAKAKGIPVVIFDSDLDDKDAYVSYVATRNERGGELAARRLAEVLGAKPKTAAKSE
jgi:ribose transport system substrate-binding protein